MYCKISVARDATPCYAPAPNPPFLLRIEEGMMTVSNCTWPTLLQRSHLKTYGKPLRGVPFKRFTV